MRVRKGKKGDSTADYVSFKKKKTARDDRDQFRQLNMALTKRDGTPTRRGGLASRRIATDLS